MPYASVDDITIEAGGDYRLVEIADQDGDGTADPAVITRAQLVADAQIDEYTGLRFAKLIGSDLLPIETASSIAAEHAVYLMRKWKGQLGEDDQRELDVRLERLRKLSVGELRPTEEVPGPSGAIKSAWVDRSGLDGSYPDVDYCVRKRGPF